MVVSVSYTRPRGAGDLDKDEEIRDGRRDNDLGTGLVTGCDGRVDERPREEIFSLVFPLLSPARPKSRAVARLGWPVAHLSRTPIGPGRAVPRFGGSGTCIVKVEQQFRFAFLDKRTYFQICLSRSQNSFCCYYFFCYGGAEAITTVAYIFKIQNVTSEDRRHYSTWERIVTRRSCRRHKGGTVVVTREVRGVR
jgi:hypothetical protein